jgi:hypothetical protein
MLLLERGTTFIVYHGTDAQFDDFNLSHLGSANGTAPINMVGFNFTDSEEVARTFGKKIISAVVTMNNPYVIDAKGRSYSEFKHQLNAKLDRVNREKYDGVIIRNYGDAGKYGDDYIVSTHYIPFSADQIRVVNLI